MKARLVLFLKIGNMAPMGNLPEYLISVLPVNDKAAILAMFLGAIAAFLEVKLAWCLGFFIGGIAYYFLMKYTSLGAGFRTDI